MPSSEMVESVYVSEKRGSNSPLQRAEKSSGLTVGAGDPEPHAKSTCGSIRDTEEPEKSRLSKYCADNPVPAPFGGDGGDRTSMLRAAELAPAPSSSIARAFTL